MKYSIFAFGLSTALCHGMVPQHTSKKHAFGTPQVERQPSTFCMPKYTPTQYTFGTPRTPVPVQPRTQRKYNPAQYPTHGLQDPSKH